MMETSKRTENCYCFKKDQEGFFCSSKVDVKLQLTQIQFSTIAFRRQQDIRSGNRHELYDIRLKGHCMLLTALNGFLCGYQEIVLNVSSIQRTVLLHVCTI